MVTREQLLHAMLPDVVFDGWVEGLFAKAASSLGIPEAEVRRHFPAGIGEAVALFVQQADKYSVAAMSLPEVAALKLPARIKTGIMARLTHCLPQREAVRRAVGYYALPHHALAGAKALYATVDAMWYAAGDASLDFSYYTKRATLAAIYSATLLVWLDDKSEGCKETEAFLERRLGDIAAFGKFKKSLIQRFGFNYGN